MTTDQTNNLKRTITVSSMYYGKPLPDAVVVMYAQDLDDLDFETVMVAINKYRRDPKNRQMFLPAHIREAASPGLQAKDIGRDTALRIREAVSRFGWSDPNGAFEYLGDSAWFLVRRFGGWQHLCENLGVSIQETTFMAQCRDAVESTVNLQRAGVDLSRPALEQAASSDRRQSQLTKFTPPILLAHKGEVT